MFCSNCGTNNAEGAAFCTNCGSALQTAPAQPVTQQPVNSDPSVNQQPAGNYQPVNPQPVNQQPAPSQPGNGLAIASLVTGIVSLIMFAVICGTLAIVFGAVAKNKGNTGKMATAGIVLGVIGIALWLLMLVACNGCTSFMNLM